MKAVTVKQLREELKMRSNNELMELCLRLSKFKKENKELLTYLLFENDEAGYIISVKEEIDLQFSKINTKSYYYINKSIRKILTQIKKYARYSLKKETEVELLFYFCQKVKTINPSINKSTRVYNTYLRQIQTLKKLVSKLHEDLQYDYDLLIKDLYFKK